MDTVTILKALADETRFKILQLLLRRSYCVRSLAKLLTLSEATISQHLKVLKDAGLITGEKCGYFMHYEVERAALAALTESLENLSNTERVTCSSHVEGCPLPEQENCRHKQRKKKQPKEA